ncbi:hypothetical protein EU527_03090 [Candidatus Thorarchaeota archaeon]|nr:MAG: hypothetical protein EU527_03090 [Candidatus Thorarchaeota archaeon]
MGFYPDTDLIVIQRSRKFGAIYRADLLPNRANLRDMKFVEAERGDVEKAVAWEKHFTEQENIDEDEFIVCIHLHT